MNAAHITNEWPIDRRGHAHHITHLLLLLLSCTSIALPPPLNHLLSFIIIPATYTTRLILLIALVARIHDLHKQTRRGRYIPSAHLNKRSRPRALAPIDPPRALVQQVRVLYTRENFPLTEIYNTYRHDHHVKKPMCIYIAPPKGNPAAAWACARCRRRRSSASAAPGVGCCTLRGLRSRGRSQRRVRTSGSFPPARA